jgi:tagaturonate reductase
LVDRIVPGYPKDKMEAITKELGYKDNLVVEGEQFHLWVIEGPPSVKEAFPAEACGLNVVFTDNMEPYRTRKVRILNGAHTALVPVGYLYGIDRVRESLEDATVGKFLKDALNENICPTLDLPKEELSQFTADVLDRFRNPYLEHELMSISLNSISKYKTRVLPSVLEFINRKNELPSHLLFSLAALIVFYKGDRNGSPIALKDDQVVLDFITNAWSSDTYTEVAEEVLSNTQFWGTDLTEIYGLKEEVIMHLQAILNEGMKTALENFIK